MKRCGWAGDDPLMIAYHDEEWGRPVHDDRVLFDAALVDAPRLALAQARRAPGKRP